MHDSNGSETIQILLFDREVRRLISRSVDSLIMMIRFNIIKMIILLSVFMMLI